MLLSQEKKLPVLDWLCFQGFFVVGVVFYLFVTCIKEVPAFPIIITIFALEKMSNLLYL